MKERETRPKGLPEELTLEKIFEEAQATADSHRLWDRQAYHNNAERIKKIGLPEVETVDALVELAMIFGNTISKEDIKEEL